MTYTTISTIVDDLERVRAIYQIAKYRARFGQPDSAAWFAVVALCWQVDDLITAEAVDRQMQALRAGGHHVS